MIKPRPSPPEYFVSTESSGGSIIFPPNPNELKRGKNSLARSKQLTRIVNNRIEKIREDFIWGFALGCLAPILYGLGLAIARKYYFSYCDPWLVAGMYDLAAGFILAAISVFLDGTTRLSSKQWALFLLGIAGGGVIAPAILFIGVGKEGTASAFFVNLQPIFTAIFARLLFKERINYIGLSLICSGGFILGWSSNIGNVLQFGSVALLWALMFSLSRIASVRVQPIRLGAIKTLVCGLFNFCLASSLTGAKLPPLALAIQIILTGFLCSGGSFVFFSYALKRVGASLAGAFYTLAPLSAIIFSVLFGEPIKNQPQLIVASLFMFVGVFFLYKKRSIPF
jgi:drug/metabolite transporter (DMT)-like permease